MKRVILPARILVVVLTFVAISIFGQPTAFTYHGRLNDATDAANGIYDLQFAIYAAPAGGSAVAGPMTNPAVTVSNGLFTVILDFGPAVFNGSARWMEIGVRTNGSGASFQVLSPRQPITATPYAIRALTAGSVPAGAITTTMLADAAVTAAKLAPGAVSQLGASDGSPADAVSVNSAGLVGIGTNDPRAALDIATTTTILTPRRLFQVQDEMIGYTNLSWAAHVAASGNLLAVSGEADDGITILDVTSARFPVRRAQFRDGDGSFTNLNGAAGLAMKPNLLAVAAPNDNAVTLVSLTNPASPVRLAELRDGIGGWNELRIPEAVAISGNLMAIAGYADNAVTLADISDPTAPIKRAEMKDDLPPFNVMRGPLTLAFSGNLLAIGAVLDDAVTLVDVTNPANPVRRAELGNDVVGYNLDGVFGVAFSGQLLAIAANVDSTVTLVNVSNPDFPVKLAEIRQGVGGVDSLAGARSVAFSGNWLAVGAWPSSAVTLFDISNPASPRQIAVIRDDVGAFNYVGGVHSITFFNGTNLAIAAREIDYALTLASFFNAPAGLLSDGWVGIGTDSPAAPLHVSGDVIVRNSQLFDINADRLEIGSGAAATAVNSTAVGRGTTAIGDYSTALGYLSTASGFASTAVAMGWASGEFSIAMGRSAQATNTGCFVWADSSFVPLSSTNDFSLSMRASGGYRLFSNTNGAAGVYLASNGVAWAALSSRDAKKNFQSINGKEILQTLATLPIQCWNYKWESDNAVPHIGPMAEDFKAAFFPGRDKATITTLEFDGVALSAIQGLNQKFEEQLKAKDARIKALERRLERLEELLDEVRRPL